MTDQQTRVITADEKKKVPKNYMINIFKMHFFLRGVEVES